MAQKLKILLIGSIILSLYVNMVKSNTTPEIVLRDQLFANVELLKEGVDRLEISVEVLNKRYINQIEKLKEIQDILKDDDDQDVCYRMSAFINSTNKKFNSFELIILTKLEQVQDEQTRLLDYIKLKGNSPKSCSTPEDSTVILNTMSPILSDLNNKVAGFAEKLTKLEAMEDMFKLQQTKLDQINHDQMKMLQDINTKLMKNQENFERFENEIPNISNMLTKMNQVVRKEPPKIPMAILLGLTNANITKS